MDNKIVTLADVCTAASSNIAQKDLSENCGEYPIYGASGFIKNVDFYKQDKPYLAIVKDGAGIGRVFMLPEYSSVIGTMQYILPNENVDIHFLYYVLTKLNLARYFSGATIPHIYFKDYKKECFSFPPLDEQRKIASVLDKVSDLIAKRRKQLDKLDELVKARFVEMFGDPESNPLSLPIVKIEEIFTVGSSKRIYQHEQTESGVPFLRIADLTEMIETGNNEPSLFISEEQYKDLQRGKYVPNSGDILVTARGTLGTCYIYKETDRFYFQDGMISWMYNMRQDVLAGYIYYLFRMHGFRKQFDSTIAGSTVNYLSIAMLKKLKVILPPICEQNKFMTFVERIDLSKSAIKKSLEKLELLKKALMQEYFGE